MNNLLTLGRAIFALALAAFGLEYLIFGMHKAPVPGPPWPPATSASAYLYALIFLTLALACSGIVHLRRVAWLPALLFLVYDLIAFLPPLLRNLRNPGPWTSGFEVLAIGAACLVLSGASWSGFDGNLVGRLAFAVSLVVFGAQHLLYGPFVAGLIPGWIPGHLFWAYFVGVAFISAAASIATGLRTLTFASLLGLMFLLWFFILHLPRVAASPQNGNEWTSAFVALAMAGGALAIAGSAPLKATAFGRLRFNRIADTEAKRRAI
jgi:uncharacterized membrane protein YphA (DoxX/SURF4 family)